MMTAMFLAFFFLAILVTTSSIALHTKHDVFAITGESKHAFKLPRYPQ